MGSPHDAAVALMRRGRFRAALSALRAPVSSGTELPSALRQLLCAELLQRTGDNDRAERIAVGMSDVPGLTDCLLARRHAVLGSIRRERGETAVAVLEFQKAILFAERAADDEQACWASLRLVAAIADHAGPDAAVGQLADARRRCTSSD